MIEISPKRSINFTFKLLLAFILYTNSIIKSKATLHTSKILPILLYSYNSNYIENDKKILSILLSFLKNTYFKGIKH